jgi:ankyrin repeat protein
MACLVRLPFLSASLPLCFAYSFPSALLIEHGALADQSSAEEASCPETPLRIAFDRKHEALATRLLHKYALTDDDMLVKAVKFGWDDIANTFIDRGFDLNLEDEERYTAFTRAAAARKIPVALRIASCSRFDIHKRVLADKYENWHVLQLAASSRSVELVQKIMGRNPPVEGAVATQHQDFVPSPLVIAAENGDLDIVPVLILTERIGSAGLLWPSLVVTATRL